MKHQIDWLLWAVLSAIALGVVTASACGAAHRQAVEDDPPYNDGCHIEPCTECMLAEAEAGSVAYFDAACHECMEGK